MGGLKPSGTGQEPEISHMTCKRKFTSDLSRREILKCGLYGPLATSLLPVLWLSGCRKPQGGKRQNVILITLDTTRADHLHCYGYDRATSPNIDRLSAASILYEVATAPTSWTLPAHVSLFTGKFTSSHGARYHPDGPLRLTDVIQGKKKWQQFRARGLAQDEVTLATLLKKARYATGAVIGGPWLKRVFGLDKGFDYYDDDQISTLNGRLAEQVTASALRWIKQSDHKKFFLFLNYFDPHKPYMPPAQFARAFLPKRGELGAGANSVEKVNALYDAEILYMDKYVGKLLDKLKAWNLYDSSFIIVTADHGELLGEHNKFGHGKCLYQQELHVPLLFKYPGTEMRANRTNVAVQLPDVFVMVLESLGIPAPEGIQGGLPPRIGHPIVAEVYPSSNPTPTAQDGDWQAIFDGHFKFLWNSKGNHVLFHLGDDPGENVNLVSQYPDRARQMSFKLKEFLAKLPPPGPPPPARELDQSTKDALRSLGYVE